MESSAAQSPASPARVWVEFEDPAEPATWPLTGRERKRDLPGHAVIVTKVANTRSSSPQVTSRRAPSWRSQTIAGLSRGCLSQTSAAML